jgi:hypothetical protein
MIRLNREAYEVMKDRVLSKTSRSTAGRAIKTLDNVKSLCCNYEVFANASGMDKQAAECLKSIKGELQTIGEAGMLYELFIVYDFSEKVRKPL